jgi:hypothetical protein
MKVKVFLIFILVIILFGYSVQGQIVSLSGKTFRLNGSDYYPMIANFRTDFIKNTSNAEIFTTPAGMYQGVQDQADANVYWQDYFLKLKSVGFNGVRITLCPAYSIDLTTQTRHFSIRIADHDPVYWWQITGVNYELNIPDFDNTASDIFFDNIENILDQAQIADIKVILLCMGRTLGDEDAIPPLPRMYPTRDLQAVNDHTVYLGKLAARLVGHPALLAYDLYNEPLYNRLDIGMTNLLDDKIQFTWKKEEICGFVRDWYDAIRQQDPDHLITIGGGVMDEVFGFDMGILKLDFFSLHLYPAPLAADGFNKTNGLERFKSILYWMDKVCPIPWIVGESGFSASDDILVPDQNIPYMFGSEQEQLSFAAMSLQYTRDANASGYSWWEIQSYNMFPLNSPEFVENHWGIFKPTVGANPPNYFPLIEKPAAAAFTTYTHPNPTPAVKPTNYYDPYNIATVYNTTKHNAVSGYVKDQNGVPIENAVVYGICWLNDVVIPIQEYKHREKYFIHTFSDHTGFFELVPYNYEQPNVLNMSILSAINITAVGCSNVRVGAYDWTTENIQMTHNVGTITLQRTHYNFDVTISNEVYQHWETPVYHGHNSITMYNAISLEGNGTMGSIGKFTAGQYIAILPDVEVELGAELSIFTTPVFSNCSQLYPYRLMTNDDSSINQDIPDLDLAFESIQIDFRMDKSFTSKVYPNPGNGLLTIELSDASHFPYWVRIYSLAGTLLRERLVVQPVIKERLNDLSKGLYIIKIENETEQNIHKLSIY